MRGLTRRWVFRHPPQDGTAAGPGAPQGPDAPLLRRVLAARGLRDPHEVRRFCEPRLTDLHDPGLLPGADAAAGLLTDAVRAGRHIAIYCDYDVDGITGCAILYHTIRAVAPRCPLRTYVPHRLEEGYGINSEALRRLRAEGAELAVSVDCGITAHEPARVAAQIGLGLIITDHHNPAHPREAMPEALAVVHPRLPGSGYPFGALCGAGVAFKLAWRFLTTWCGSQRVGAALQSHLLSMLPLATLGTIADVGPLLDENRTIAHFGLRWIRQTPLAGLRALIEAGDLMGEQIDSGKVGFILAPRLNALGRMGHAAEAVRLLTEAGPEEAATIARRLTAVNRQRQETERRITEHAATLAQEAGMTGEERRAIVLADESFHAGVLGIVCSRLAERYGRPVVLMQREGDVCRGSARSVEGYSIYEGLSAASSLLTRYGGHDAAAGLELAASDLPAFVDALTAHANEHISAEELTPVVCIDCDASMEELDYQTVRRMGGLSPFGRDNPPPTVRLRGVSLGDPPRAIGANGRHLALCLRCCQDHAQRRWMRGVWFGAGDLAGSLATGMRLDAVAEPRINSFNGLQSVEVELRDLRPVQVP